MAFRELVLNNFKWKLGALTMAMFVWVIIQVAMSRGYNPGDHPLSDVRTRTFSSQPVLVLRKPDDPQLFKVSPAKVDITIRSATVALGKLAGSDLKAFVSVVDAPDTGTLTKEVFVRGANGLEFDSIKVEPPAVTLERVAKPE